MANFQTTEIRDSADQQDEQGLELLAYARIVLKRWWVFALAVVITMSVAFYISDNRELVYKATAKILVQGGQAPGPSSAGDIQTSQQLARSLTDLLGTRPILEQVAVSAGFEDSSQIAGSLSITNRRSLLEITASRGDAESAADLANVAAQVFVDQFIRQQLTALAELQAALALYNLGESADIISAQVASLRTLSVAEEALPPLAAESAMRLYLLLGLAAGLLIGGMLALVLEYREDGIRSPEQLSRLTRKPTLGSVSYQARRSFTEQASLDGSLAEQYSFIQTNLDFSSLGLQRLRALLITSAGPGDGKSSIASGLGISIAKQGKPTILLDADLRRPSLHRKFDLGDGLGFTDLLLGKAAPSDVMVPIGDTSLFVIRSGPIPPDPPTLFRSSRLREVLEDLEKVAALVIIDSPPLLAVTDPMLLADVADAAVLVVDMRNTRRAALRHASDLLHRGGVDVLGTILNKSKSRSSSYYAYGYGYDAESDGSTGLAARPWRTLKRLARRR